jgi:GT2 family glycosyltransferase
VELADNTGFATGNNRGFEQARGDYIVTLNNDTWAEPDWLETLVRVADAHPDVGMVASRICSFFEPDVLDSIGMAICRDGMARGNYRNQRWSTLALREVEEILMPSACAALYKREMLDQIGFFDDDFFAYAEDVDLALRGRLAGWAAVAASQAVVYHKYSQTGGRLSPFKVYLVERNHYWVAWKNFPWSQLAVLPLFSLWRYAEQVRAVLAERGTGHEFRSSGSQRDLGRALVKGLWDSLCGLPVVLRKRRQVMKCQQLPWCEFKRLLRIYRLTFKELLDYDGN